MFVAMVNCVGAAGLAYNLRLARRELRPGVEQLVRHAGDERAVPRAPAVLGEDLREELECSTEVVPTSTGRPSQWHDVTRSATAFQRAAAVRNMA